MLLFSKVVYTVEENDHHSSLIGGHSQLDISEDIRILYSPCKYSRIRQHIFPIQLACLYFYGNIICNLNPKRSKLELKAAPNLCINQLKKKLCLKGILDILRLNNYF